MSLPGGYVWPSQCELCVAVPTYELAGAMGREYVTYAHQEECPNNPVMPTGPIRGRA